MKGNFEIESHRLLAVEGKDECNFFEGILKHIGIEGVQLVDICGKDRFKKEFPLLYNLDGFLNVRILGFIRDAEDKKADAAFSRTRSILGKYPLPIPDAANTIIDGKNSKGENLRISVFIMPNNTDQGMLENLCLESVREEPISACADQYLACCLSALPENRKPINCSKARVQTYLAAQEKIANSLGVGARKGYWNFDHICFDDIKRFLRELFVD